MSPGQLWSAYIRYTGAGAVLAAGLITLARTIPTIVSSFRDSMRDFSAKGAGGGRPQPRTERDMPMTVVLVGTLLLALFLALAPPAADAGQLRRLDPGGDLRVLLRHGVVAHRRADRLVVEPDFRA